GGEVKHLLAVAWKRRRLPALAAVGGAVQVRAERPADLGRREPDLGDALSRIADRGDRGRNGADDVPGLAAVGGLPDLRADLLAAADRAQHPAGRCAGPGGGIGDELAGGRTPGGVAAAVPAVMMAMAIGTPRRIARI